MIPRTGGTIHIDAADILQIEAAPRWDITGKLVDVLVNGRQDSGNYSIQWKPGGVSSGVHIIALRSDQTLSIRKWMLIN